MLAEKQLLLPFGYLKSTTDDEVKERLLIISRLQGEKSRRSDWKAVIWPGRQRLAVLVGKLWMKVRYYWTEHVLGCRIALVEVCKRLQRLSPSPLLGFPRSLYPPLSLNLLVNCGLLDKLWWLNKSMWIVLPSRLVARHQWQQKIKCKWTWEANNSSADWRLSRGFLIIQIDQRTPLAAV